MPIFECSKCNCIENTASSNYWIHKHPIDETEPIDPLCSECDPEIKKWHGLFEKVKVDYSEYKKDEYGFLVSI